MPTKTVDRLGYHSTQCPYCGKTIFIPEYRIIPITAEEARQIEQEQTQGWRKKEKAKILAKLHVKINKV